VTPDIVEDAVNEALGLIVGDERTTDTTTTRIRAALTLTFAGSSANAIGSLRPSPPADSFRDC
jgi:hypothetical protein